MRLLNSALFVVVLAGTTWAQHPVSGRVTGPDGKPVAGMVLRFQMGRSIVDCFGDPEGRFTTRSLAAGRWQMLAVMGPPIVRPKEIVIRDAAVPEALQVRVEKLWDTGRITGRVQDEDGKPVQGAWVLAGDRSQPTDFYGEFQLERGIGRSPARFRLVVPNYGQKIQRAYPYRQLTAYPTWGQRRITLVVKNGIPAKLKVIDGDTGEPVPRYWFRLWGWPWGHWMLPGHHVVNAEGVTALPGLDVGWTRLIVYPDVPGYMSSWPHSFDVRDVADQVFEVKVYRHRRLVARLLDHEGNPMEASNVALWETGDTPVSPFQMAFRPRSPHVLELKSPVRLASGVTDEEGKVVLKARPTKTSLCIVAQGPGHVPKLVRVAAVTREPREVTVRVRKGATVTGKLVGFLAPSADALSLHMRGRRGDLQILARVPRSNVWYPRMGFPIFADGTFEVRHVPPGEWGLVPFGPIFGVQLGILPLASMKLAEGQKVDMELDTDKLRPGRIGGKLVMGDTPLRDRVIWAEGCLPGQNDRTASLRARTNEAGEFEFVGMAPVQWRLYMSLVEKGRSANRHTTQTICFAQDLSLAPGQKLIRTFKVKTRSLSVRILSPDGKVAVPHRYLGFQPDEAPSSTVASRVLAKRFTDAAGIVPLSHAPLQRLRVYTWPTGWEMSDLDPVQVRQGKHRLLVGILDPRRMKEGQQVSLRLSREH